jgi:hypothetical protein
MEGSGRVTLEEATDHAQALMAEHGVEEALDMFGISDFEEWAISLAGWSLDLEDQGVGTMESRGALLIVGALTGLSMRNERVAE